MKPTPEQLAKLNQAATASKHGDRDARRIIDEAKRNAAKRAASPAGLAALFPGLVQKSAPPPNAAQVRALDRQGAPPIKLDPSIHQITPAIAKGEIFTIAGLKADATKPGGWDTHCKPGEESRLVHAGGDTIEKA